MRIKFLTLNIWNGGILFDPMLAFLKEQDADIIALQEVYDGKDSSLERRWQTVEILKRELSLSHISFVSAFLDRKDVGDIERGSAVFSRYPITKTDNIFFDVPYGVYSEQRLELKDFFFLPRNLQHVEIQAEKKVSIFNIHGIWGTDDRDNERRTKMTEKILTSIAGKEHVILAGDFNMGQDTMAVAMLEKELKNVFKNELQTTFNMRQKKEGGFSTSVVDMVFVSGNMKVVEKQCPDVDVSDHLPLACTVEF